MNWYLVIETAYYLAGVLVAAAAIYAAQQVRLIKRDILLRNKRAAGDSALALCKDYHTTNTDLETRFVLACLEQDIPLAYEGSIGDFSPASVDASWRPSMEKRTGLMLKWLPYLNHLDAIAAGFISSIADEEIGFSVIGRSFCSSVETMYDVLSISRGSKCSKHYQSIVDLYALWSPRLKKGEMEIEKRDLESRIGALRSEKIQALGTE